VYAAGLDVTRPGLYASKSTRAWGPRAKSIGDQGFSICGTGKRMGAVWKDERKSEVIQVKSVLIER
jgi:hypothetical protein